MCTILIGVVCILGIAGNMTSFVVLWKHTTETATTFILRCLAISDTVLLAMSILIYSVTAIYPYTQDMRMEGVHKTAMKTREYIWPFAMMAHTCTIWLVVLVTWNRYCATCRPVGQYSTQVSHMVRCQALVVVLFSVLYSTPRFFEHQTVDFKEIAGPTINNRTNISLTGAGPTRTPLNLGDNKIYQILYSNILYFPVMYIVPLLSLTYLNYRLIKNINAIKMKHETLTGHHKEDNITLCIIVIVFVFILSQTPALINQIFWAALSSNDRECGDFHSYYTIISDFLVVTNSSCNFVIYCLFGKSFRRIFLDNLCDWDFIHTKRKGQAVPADDNGNKRADV